MKTAKNVDIAELCKGSTTDSDSVCLGSNPSSAAIVKSPFRWERALFFIFQVFMRESVDMASGKEYMTYIMEQLSDIEDISCRPMMGEYILYYRGKVVGAVWTRIMDDYGHVDDDTPSFAISLYKEYRGQGIGSQLMVKMLGLLKWQGYDRASLAVQKANYAVKMYKDVGFKIIDENAEEYIMVCEL